MVFTFETGASDQFEQLKIKRTPVHICSNQERNDESSTNTAKSAHNVCAIENILT